MYKPYHFTFLILSIFGLSACSTIDFEQPKSVTYAVEDTSETYLGQQLIDLAIDSPSESGFYLINDGIEALSLRVLLAARAESTIDAQYYLITDDETGTLFLNALLQAADRGVRVRFLIDDVLTGGYDLGMAALDSHPNFEVRAFNPFPRGARNLSWLTDFSRVNRRMHNKAFIVDNQVAIIGGRNIASEYFGANEVVNFGDLDALTVGPIVPEISEMFDQYWNSDFAVPANYVVGEPEDPEAALSLLHENFDAALNSLRSSPYGAVLQEQLLDNINAKANEELIFSEYNLIYDSPDKSDPELAEKAASMLPELASALTSAKEELIIITPYFVPSDEAIEGIKELIEDGVRVVIITNSLAANNHSVVHAGYMNSRIPLLSYGAELYEVIPDIELESSARAGNSSAAGTLHIKAFLIDRRYIYLGSFNWDPRSININTEMGVIIDSEELGQLSSQAIEAEIPQSSYKLILDENRDIRWLANENGEEVIYTKEPNTSWGLRAFVKFVSWLPVRGLL